MIGFVDTPKYKWSQEDKENTLCQIPNAITILQSQAKHYNANITIRWRYWDNISVPCEYYDRGEPWHLWIMKNYWNVKSMRELQNGIRIRQRVKEAPVILLFKQPQQGRYQGFSWSAKRPSNWEDEISCVLCDNGFSSTTFAHEILHQFGAIDYYDIYDNEGISSIADKYLGKDLLMQSGNYGRIDDLTAYIIGWTNYLSNDAKSFLNETRGAR